MTFNETAQRRREEYSEPDAAWKQCQTHSVNGKCRIEAAAQATLDELDRRTSTEKQERRAAMADMNIPERVANAFITVPPTEAERALIQALLDNPGSTSKQLDEAMGWKRGWHLHFGKLAGAREHLLWPAEPVKGQKRSYKGGILADFDEDSRGITMKPEVVEGLGMIGIKPARR